MIDFDASPRLRMLFYVARRRVILGFVVAIVSFIFATPTWDSLVLGVPIAVVGEAIRVWASGHLVKGKEVTTSGPYALVRHPLYVGSSVMGLGFVIAASSWLVAAVVCCYLIVMVPVAVLLEEATLRASFGDVHARYVAGLSVPMVRRFSVPRVFENREHHALAGFVASFVLLYLLAGV